MFRSRHCRLQPAPALPCGAAPAGAISRKEFELALATVGEIIARELGKLEAKINAKLASLEAKQVKPAGIWKAGQRYAENSLVTFAGGLWLARCETDTRPGSESPLGASP